MLNTDIGVYKEEIEYLKAGKIVTAGTAALFILFALITKSLNPGLFNIVASAATFVAGGTSIYSGYLTGKTYNRIKELKKNERINSLRTEKNVNNEIKALYSIEKALENLKKIEKNSGADIASIEKLNLKAKKELQKLDKGNTFSYIEELDTQSLIKLKNYLEKYYNNDNSPMKVHTDITFKRLSKKHR